MYLQLDENDASLGFEKNKEKTVYFKIKDKRQKRISKKNLGDLVRTADIKKRFSKGDSTN